MLKKIIWNFEEILTIAFLGVMAVVMILQVASRYLFNAPLIWSEELTRFLFVWITFIGAGYGVKKHLHIEMEVVFNLFPKGMQKVVQIILNILAIVFYAYIIPYAIKFTASQYDIESTTLGISMSFLYVAVPIGCSFVVIRTIIDTINIKNKEEEREQVFVE